MTTDKHTDHYHNCRIYRPMGLTDGSVKFLGFLTAFGRQAKSSKSRMRVYDKNFEIMLAPSRMFNEPSRWISAWSHISSAAILREVISQAPETCTSPTTLYPNQAVWLPNDENNPLDDAHGVLALSFKDPNSTIDETNAFAKIIGELSSGKVHTKDSAGMLIFASAVPKSIGVNVVGLMNTEANFMNQPFTFEPAEYLGPRVKN